MQRDAIIIGIVAGEVSGDLLGAGLMNALKQRIPNITFEGIGGPMMQRAGCKSLFPMEPLSIVGVVELFGSLLSVLRIRWRLARHFIKHPPDVFIGVDVPQFNIGLEEKLKATGIPTIHYVSPTVWAWRGYRIHHIKKAVDHMMVLFPFEESLYKNRNIPVSFVGHPLADQIKQEPDRMAARRMLGLPESQVVVGLLPGSRYGELKRHADLFVKTALWLYRRNSKLCFVAPFIGKNTRDMFEQAITDNAAGFLPLTIIDGYSRDVMEAADVLVMASGTATLEAALLKRPMVVTYKVAFLTYLLVKMVSHIKLYAMPNALAGRELVPELLQFDATPEKIGRAAEYFLSHPEYTASVRHELEMIGDALRRDADTAAAEAVMEVLRKHAGKVLTQQTADGPA